MHFFCLASGGGDCGESILGLSALSKGSPLSEEDILVTRALVTSSLSPSSDCSWNIGVGNHTVCYSLFPAILQLVLAKRMHIVLVDEETVSVRSIMHSVTSGRGETKVVMLNIVTPKITETASNTQEWDHLIGWSGATTAICV